MSPCIMAFLEVRMGLLDGNELPSSSAYFAMAAKDQRTYCIHEAR